jgi:outer membrane protein assembly factor BamA
VTTLKFVVVLAVAVGISYAQNAHKTAPKPADSNHTLLSINVSGSQRFSPDEIIATTGLKVGDLATEDDFRKVTQDLGETGMFTDVSYSYSYSRAGTKLELHLADSDKLVPARFENFVWFSDADLISKVHQREPLFNGQVPVGGTLTDHISDALQSLLLRHSLSARAEYIREGAGPSGPIDAINFRAAGMNIHIRNVSFPSAPADQVSALTSAAKKLEGRDYLHSEVNAYARSALLPVYLRNGFLKASFAEPQAKVVHEDEDETQVDVDLTSTPGSQYKISSFSWEGDSAFPAAKLQPLITGQPNQIANAVQLETDLESVHKLYGTRGYMLATVTPEPTFDDGSSTVAYKLVVHEGDLFHMGDLEITGLDSKTADRLEEAWDLKQSDVYDSSYPKRFIEKVWKLLPPKTNWTVDVHEGVNEKEKTVDVSLRYGIKPD